VEESCMKLTKTKLKEIIREEILNEAIDISVISKALKTYNDDIASGIRLGVFPKEDRDLIYKAAVELKKISKELGIKYKPFL